MNKLIYRISNVVYRQVILVALLATCYLLLTTSVDAQDALISPNAEDEACPADQATTGSPLNCSVGENSGQTFLRYVGNNADGSPLCRRTFCLNPTTLEPFEQTCTEEEANTGAGIACTNPAGTEGSSFLRYSFTDQEGNNYCYRSQCVADSPPPSNPSPSTALLPTSNTREEQAVYNISNGNLPPEIVNQPVEEANAIIQALRGFAAFVSSFISPPTQQAKYYAQAERVGTGETPPQLIPEGGDFFDNLQSFVGKNTGFYSAGLPPELQSSEKKISDYEKSFESSYFPEGIAPITGQ